MRNRLISHRLILCLRLCILIIIPLILGRKKAVFRGEKLATIAWKTLALERSNLPHGANLRLFRCPYYINGFALQTPRAQKPRRSKEFLVIGKKILKTKIVKNGSFFRISCKKKAARSVGIGKNHTPIMENAASIFRIAEFILFVKMFILLTFQLRLSCRA